MTRNRMSEVLKEIARFGLRVEHWTWETFDELLDIAYDILARFIELVLALMNLIFYMIRFLRDLCIGTIQTFANIFHGIVKIVSNISCEEIEDFAAACIVVILWIGAFKFVRNFVCRVPTGSAIVVPGFYGIYLYYVFTFYPYHGEGKTDVGANSVSTDGTQGGWFKWTNQRALPNNNKDEPEKLCLEMCSDENNTIKQSNQRYGKESESESEESD